MADGSTFDKVAGRAKEFVKKVTGDRDTGVEGRAQHVRGKMKEFAEGVKSDIKAVEEKIRGTFKRD